MAKTLIKYKKDTESVTHTFVDTDFGKYLQRGDLVVIKDIVYEVDNRVYLVNEDTWGVNVEEI